MTYESRTTREDTCDDQPFEKSMLQQVEELDFEDMSIVVENVWESIFHSWKNV